MRPSTKLAIDLTAISQTVDSQHITVALLQAVRSSSHPLHARDFAGNLFPRTKYNDELLIEQARTLRTLVYKLAVSGRAAPERTGAQTVAIVIKAAITLEDLRVHGCRTTPLSMTPLLQHPRCLPELRVLIMCDISVTEAALVGTAARCERLTELELQTVRLQHVEEEDWVAVFRALQLRETLTSLKAINAFMSNRRAMVHGGTWELAEDGDEDDSEVSSQDWSEESVVDDSYWDLPLRIQSAGRSSVEDAIAWSTDGMLEWRANKGVYSRYSC